MSSNAMIQKTTVLKFNDCINRRDIEGLSRLITDDHVFIDSSGQVEKDKKEIVKQWQGFFEQFPDYKNHFSTVESRANLVVVVGHSTCSFDPLNGPALWTANVQDGLVAEWRVYEDSPENRKKLKVKS